MLKDLEAGKYDDILAWHPDRLARNLFTNLEINNKKEVTYRVKKPLESLVYGRLTEKSRSGEPGGTRTHDTKLKRLVL